MKNKLAVLSWLMFLAAAPLFVLALVTKKAVLAPFGFLFLAIGILLRRRADR